AARADPLPALTHHGRWLTDPQGRVVIVHGLQEWGPNGPLPGPLPFGHKVPSTLGYGADDAQFLADNGFNAMRLSLSYWEHAPGTTSGRTMRSRAGVAYRITSPTVGVTSRRDSGTCRASLAMTCSTSRGPGACGRPAPARPAARRWGSTTRSPSPPRVCSRRS